jgi:hypothetical protein
MGVAAVAFFAFAGSVQGQESPDITVFTRDSLRPGLRVRLFSPGFLFRHTGSVQNVIGDTLVFQSETERQVLRVPLATLQTLEVSTEKKLTSARLFSGAAVGFVGGFVVSRFVQFAVVKSDNRSCLIFKCIGPLNIGISLGGMAAGILFVKDHPTDNWRTVMLR